MTDSFNARDQRHVFLALDALRGVAAVAIVIRHGAVFFGGGIMPNSHLAVDLFFALSGFVLAHAYGNRLLGEMSPWTFVGLRLVRLFPLYVLGSVLVIAGYAIVGYEKVDLTQPKFAVAAIAALFMLPFPAGNQSFLYFFNPPAWSLFFELIANIAFAFCAIRLRGIAPKLAVLVVSGPLLILFGHKFGTLDLGYALQTAFAGVPRVAYSFVMGLLLYDLYAKLGRPVFALGPAIALLVALLVPGLFLLNPATWSVDYQLLCAMLIFPALIMMFALLQPTGRWKKPFAFIGLTSYAVYVLQYPALRFAQVCAQKMGIDPARYAPLDGIALMAGYLLVCWLVDRAYDAPLRRRLSKLVLRATPARRLS